ncbi:hypothetical protein H920_10500 [Fukomys damarensis]|uniref:Uncharacterized protein n=1 Tax=Fukomys damarensis TaxID=885580 RepID=A0A091DZ81_FUKDA|nr:hypothetical protein H920_10500 [Fukomys damarensis]
MVPAPRSLLASLLQVQNRNAPGASSTFQMLLLGEVYDTVSAAEDLPQMKLPACLPQFPQWNGTQEWGSGSPAGTAQQGPDVTQRRHGRRQPPCLPALLAHSARGRGEAVSPASLPGAVQGLPVAPHHPGFLTTCDLELASCLPHSLPHAPQARAVRLVLLYLLISAVFG